MAQWMYNDKLFADLAESSSMQMLLYLVSR